MTTTPTNEEKHSIHCASYTSEGLLKRGHIPGECNCKVSPSKSSDEKPDFKKLGDDYYNSTPVNHIGVTSFDYAAGCEKIWNNYVSPLFKKNLEIVSVSTQLQFDNSALQKELSELKESYESLKNISDHKEKLQEGANDEWKLIVQRLKEERDELKAWKESTIENFLDPIMKYGQSAGFKLGSSITEETIKRAKERDYLSSEIGELLAVMHGDGGHYQEKHGTIKAIKDAGELLHTKWVSNEHLTDINEISKERDSLKSENERLLLLRTEAYHEKERLESELTEAKNLLTRVSKEGEENERDLYDEIEAFLNKEVKG